MEAVVVHVPMAAFGKARPRVTSRGTFMPSDYTARKDELRWHFAGVDIPEGLVHLSVTAVREMPAQWSKRKKGDMRGTYAKPKPDVDNLAGAVMDALFDDDDRVISLFCEKVWGEQHELIIEISPVRSGNGNRGNGSN